MEPRLEHVQTATSESGIWIVIPAFNEEKVIAEVLDSLCQAQRYSIVVVDDGSTDDTTAEAVKLPVHVLRHSHNCGTGAALQRGFDYALEHGARFIVTFDADGQHNPADLPELLRPLLEDNYAVTLGSRFLDARRSHFVPPIRRALLRLAVMFTRALSRIDVTDTHNGLRAFTAEALRQIRLTQPGMAHASEILSLIVSHDLPFKEVPVTIFYTPYSLKKGQGIINIFTILWDLLSSRFSSR